MMFTFKWKLIDSDAFEQNIFGETFTQAFELWQDLWGITMDDCEAFSFSHETAKMAYDMKSK